jgi:hypothetical protein
VHTPRNFILFAKPVIRPHRSVTVLLLSAAQRDSDDSVVGLSDGRLARINHRFTRTTSLPPFHRPIHQAARSASDASGDNCDQTVRESFNRVARQSEP